MTSAIDSAGRIVIPSELRNRSGLRPGTEVEFELLTDGSVAVRPKTLKVRLEKSGRFPKLVPLQTIPMLTNEEVLKSLDEVRK